MSSNPGSIRRSVVCPDAARLPQKYHKLMIVSKLISYVCLYLYALSSAQTSQHPNASPASGPAQPLHRGPAAPDCLRPDSLLPPDVSPHTSQPWSAGETHTCMLKCAVRRRMRLCLQFRSP